LSENRVSELKEVVITEKRKTKRIEAYSVLAAIAKRTNDSSIIEFLIERLTNENGKSLIGQQLMNFYWTKIPLFNNSHIVIDFAKANHNSIRHGAIQLLSLFEKGNSQIEDFLISLLGRTEDPYDVYYTHITLQSIGSIKSVESLKKSIQESKKSDNLITGVYALGFIDGENQVDFFLDLFPLSRDSFVKSTLTEFITEHADNRAIDVMIQRTKQILSRKCKRNMHYGTNQKPELIHALLYLTRYENIDLRIPKLKRWIGEKKMDFLDDTESRLITDLI